MIELQKKHGKERWFVNGGEMTKQQVVRAVVKVISP